MNLRPPEGKLYCLTGTTGFLGGAFQQHLIDRNLRFLAMNRPRLNQAGANLIGNGHGIIEDTSNWSCRILEVRPSFLFSFDWSGVHSKARNNHELQQSNYDRIMRLAESALEVKSELFVTFGSQAEVASSLCLIEENQSDYPQDAYGRWKVRLRQDLEKLFAGSSTRFVWCRVFTIYGPGDTRNSFINSKIKSMVKNESLTISNPNNLWSILHVSDFIQALDKILNADSITGTVNIGSSFVTTVSEVAEVVTRIFQGQSLEKIAPRFLSELNQLSWIPDTSYLQSVGWNQKMVMTEGLRDTISWWRKSMNLELETE